MIQVKNLTKRYGELAAVDGISFTIEPSRIVGFLGPNGAGKTTTLRLLAGLLAPSAGTATVAGFDILTDSLEVRRRIGYLPENVPLYPEMRVAEYLRYRARLKEVPRGQVGRRIGQSLERCGIEDVAGRIIGQLSKGYRQRVGLADCLVHDPPVLLLDEPTIGLDPNQIRLVHAMIRELARDHTILLSTHILPEVEITCDAFLLIDLGRIVAEDSLDGLKARGVRLDELFAQVAAGADAPAGGSNE